MTDELRYHCSGTLLSTVGWPGAYPNQTGARAARIHPASATWYFARLSANVVNRCSDVYYLTYRQFRPAMLGHQFRLSRRINEECERHDHYVTIAVWAGEIKVTGMGGACARWAPRARHKTQLSHRQMEFRRCWPVALATVRSCAQGHFWDNMSPF
jgi:hypothetical protein